MAEQDDIRRALEGKPPWTGTPAPKRKPTAKGPRTYRQSSPQTPKTVASERSSMLAQRWYDLGEAEGFAFPYNVNFFAVALQRKVETDKEIKPFLDADKHDQVQRWIRKMIDLWWDPVDEEGSGGYLTGDINQSNAKDFFLDKDWDDLRDYARSCLRAAYLKEHHRVAPRPIYTNQQAYQAELQEIHDRAVVDQHLRRLEEDPAPERGELDPEGRKRLRSFRDKRRKK